MKNYLMSAAFVAALAFAPAALAQSNDFDDAGDTAGWTVDRYAPENFQSGVSDGSRLVLLHQIDASDNDAGRGAQGSAFYRTQGMQSPVFDPGTTSFSVEMFVGEDWDQSGHRMGSAWGIARDAGNAISAYPIIDYSSDALFGPGFRGYDPTAVATNGWVNLGDAHTNYGGWNLLTITLNAGNWDYAVNGTTLASIGANGSTHIERAILQGYNPAQGATYDIKWDNLDAPGMTAPVPEPATWAMMIMGFGAAGSVIRRRRSATTVALAA